MYKFFEGVSVTTVILAPGACGLGLRAALLATTSAAPVAAVAAAAPAAVFQKSPISCYLSYLRARGLSKIDPNPSWPQSGLGGALGEPWRAILAAENPGRAILAAEKPWAGYFGRGKTLGGLFWPRKSLGRAILLRRNRAGAILAAEKPCARAHSGNLTHRLCIFDT